MLRRFHIIRNVVAIYLALLALLVPVIGPSMDHHFYERLVFHTHTFVGDVDIDHTHVYDSQPSEEANNFIATSADGPSSGFVQLAVHGLAQEIALDDFDLGILGYPTDEYLRPNEVKLASLRRPPKKLVQPTNFAESVERSGNV